MHTKLNLKQIENSKVIEHGQDADLIKSSATQKVWVSRVLSTDEYYFIEVEKLVSSKTKGFSTRFQEHYPHFSKKWEIVTTYKVTKK